MLPSLERDFGIEIGVLNQSRISLSPILKAISMDYVGPTPVACCLWVHRVPAVSIKLTIAT